MKIARSLIRRRFEMVDFPKRLHKISSEEYSRVPSKTQSSRFLDSLLAFLFPIIDNSHGRSVAEVEVEWERLRREFLEILNPICIKERCECDSTMEDFFAQIPDLYDSLRRDAELYSTNDPASHSKEEVILCYPGFLAVAVYRIAHIISDLKVPILPRIISEYAHSNTGIDIHPRAEIGKNFYIDHGTGIVIGETTVIGNNVTIYQGVTLGATFVDKTLRGVRRHPTIEDNVIIYAGSTILGGETVIGHDTIVGGNVWITESVPPHSKVYHRPEVEIRDTKKIEEKRG